MRKKNKKHSHSCIASHYQCYPCVNAPSPGCWARTDRADTKTEPQLIFFARVTGSPDLPPQGRSGPHPRSWGVLDAWRDTTTTMDVDASEIQYSGPGIARPPGKVGPPPRRCAVADKTQSGVSVTGMPKKLKGGKKMRYYQLSKVSTVQAPLTGRPRDFAHGLSVDLSLLVYYTNSYVSTKAVSSYLHVFRITGLATSPLSLRSN